MRYLLVSLLLIIGLMGCASQRIAELSTAEDWVGLANYDVEAGRKARSEQDLTSLGASDKEQQSEYQTAYEAHVKEYCKPDNGYHAGISGKPRNSVCIDDAPQGWLYEDNWETGLEAGKIF
ncbi:DUF2799 domain-containing protein [Enterovibrio norvegicus]|uniref:Lipoprotein n=2 Tax=Enterovibrio norvegicus TaxID=188144 RepID=A0A1I5Y1Z3_9GAMM|nr:DUF2799 domain-containing protein [Enterovibrio norvegicus]OEF59054.1 hypothetical protein A1OU_12990 [Enterovibrio norvegicus]PMH64234.1 hypothetical protein BCU62_01540 [Enterovibrio norvegicus]SFQ38154.1 Protein of unknown function [Enterovibrio norvegicus DSM 15893]